MLKQARPIRLTASLCLLLPLAAACATSEEKPDSPDPEEQPGLDVPAEEKVEAPPTGQLPADVMPLRYRLELDIDPAEERFAGTVEIDVRLDRARTTIWLHGQNMQVDEAVVRRGDQLIPATFVQKTDSGLAELKLAAPLDPGEASIRLVYTAPFDTQLKGLYRVVDDGNAYAFTQFESHFARLCFPSFDEPRFKTPFDIRVTSKSGDEVITTTAEQKRTELDDGRVQRDFGTTVPLPTYLIAFAVGPLEIVEKEGGLPPNSVRKEPLPFRGVAAKGRGARLKYALDNTAPLLDVLEEYFGVPYPFGKLDVIAVPDFSSGAMENVGAVTFRETLLLVDEKTAPVGQKQWFAGVMAHELAHMWFGNIVTMPWWDDIWLNEAFATWMASKVVHEVRPEWNADVSFTERVLGAMGSDALTSARQIRNPVTSDDDIRNAFDSITYSKGGGVLAMFERWLGEETFRDGLRRYMDKHRFGSATWEDLVGALSEASGRDVKTPFSTFLFQPGVPLLDVKLDCAAAPKLTFAQSRYLPLGSPGDSEASWRAPVCVSYPDGDAKGERKEQCALLEGKPGEELALETKTCPAWVLPNAAAAGYLRFTLPDDMWTKVPLDKLSPAERVIFADSLGAAFAAGRVDAGAYLAALPALAGDDNRAVARSALGRINGVVEKLVAAPTVPKAKAWARKALAKQRKRLGTSARKGDSADVRKLRANVLGALALRFDDDKTLRALAKLGDKALAGKTVDPDLRPIALTAAVRVGGAKAFDKALAQLKASDDALLRGQLLGALAATQDEALAARARALSVDTALRGNEVLTPLWVQSGHPATREQAWKFLQDSWGELTRIIPTTRQTRLPWLAGGFCKKSRAAEAKAFFEGRVDGIVGAPRNLKGALEAIELCAARVDHHREAAEAFFASQKKLTGR
jgi:alanyl aminopeptidase